MVFSAARLDRRALGTSGRDSPIRGALLAIVALEPLSAFPGPRRPHRHSRRDGTCRLRRGTRGGRDVPPALSPSPHRGASRRRVPERGWLRSRSAGPGRSTPARLAQGRRPSVRPARAGSAPRSAGFHRAARRRDPGDLRLSHAGHERVPAATAGTTSRGTACTCRRWRSTSACRACRPRSFAMPRCVWVAAESGTTPLPTSCTWTSGASGAGRTPAKGPLSSPGRGSPWPAPSRGRRRGRRCRRRSAPRRSRRRAPSHRR